jgi:hypothetical protein
MTDDGSSMPVYETITETLADGTVQEVTKIAGEEEEVTNEEVEAEINNMIKEVEVIEESAKEAT